MYVDRFVAFMNDNPRARAVVFGGGYIVATACERWFQHYSIISVVEQLNDSTKLSGIGASYVFLQLFL